MTVRKYQTDSAVACDVPTCDNEIAGVDEDDAKSRAALKGWSLGKQVTQTTKADICDECRERAQAAIAAVMNARVDPGDPIDILAKMQQASAPSAASVQAARNAVPSRGHGRGRNIPDPMEKKGASMPGVVVTPEEAKRRAAQAAEDRANRGKPINMNVFEEVDDLLHDTAWSPSARKGGSS